MEKAHPSLNSEGVGCIEYNDSSLYLTTPGCGKQEAVLTAAQSPESTPDLSKLQRGLLQVAKLQPGVSEQHFTSSDEYFTSHSDRLASVNAEALSRELQRSKNEFSQTLPDASFSQEEEFLEQKIVPDRIG